MDVAPASGTIPPPGTLTDSELRNPKQLSHDLKRSIGNLNFTVWGFKMLLLDNIRACIWVAKHSDHLFRKRALPPVCQLILFVKRLAAVNEHHVVQGETFAQKAGIVSLSHKSVLKLHARDSDAAYDSGNEHSDSDDKLQHRSLSSRSEINLDEWILRCGLN